MDSAESVIAAPGAADLAKPALRIGWDREAKAAVEASLRPVEVEAAANMNHPEPMLLAA